MRRKTLLAAAAVLVATLAVGGAVAGYASATPAKKKPQKNTVTLCHRTGDATNPLQTIRVSKNALAGHVGHGDFLVPAGGCPKAAGNVGLTFVTGQAENGGVFNGVFDVTSFAVENGKLVAKGSLTGTVFSGKKFRTTQNVAGTPVTLPLASAAAGQTCKILHLTLGPLDLNLLGLKVHLSKVVLDITAERGPGNLLGNLLCAVANLLNGQNPLQVVATVLNQVAGDLNPVDVTGAGTNGEKFAGTFTPKTFAVQNGQLVLNGLLNGTITDSAGKTKQVTNENAALPVTAPGAAAPCQILHLTLGPLDLNLLGLKVHLNKVVLDITAQPGPGNLLGNLLCSLAGLLDNKSPQQVVADILNRLIKQ